MKKIGLLALALAVMISATSCSLIVTKSNMTVDETASVEKVEPTVEEITTEAVTTTEDKEEVVELPEVYKNLLEVCKTGIETGFTPEQYENEGLTALFSNYSNPSDIMYAVEDLDENGVYELIVCDVNETVLNMFTVSEDAVVTLLSGAERNVYRLFEDGFVISDGANSAYAGEYVVFVIKEADLVPSKYFVYDYSANPENPQYYFSTKTDVIENMSPISSESAEEMLGGYMPVELDFEILK